MTANLKIIPSGAFKVEKGVPLPSPPIHLGSTAIYPFRELEVGDSFFIPGERMANHTARQYAYKRGKDLGRRFTFRSVDGGYRIWRTA